MPTDKRRLNLSLTKDVDLALQKIAQRDEVPEATKAMELLIRGLEIEEDEIWDSLASSRDTDDAQFMAHKQVWS